MIIFNKAIISRTDNIGDVVLSLPVAGYLKKVFPEIKIFFLGKAYTQPIIDACKHIDGFLNREDVLNDNNLLKSFQADFIIHLYPDKAIAVAAKKAQIPLRIGTSHRIFHWFNCNKLVNLSRKKSGLHESLLNLKLLSPISVASVGIDKIPDYYGLHHVVNLPSEITTKIAVQKTKIILHPKSKGSAREWPMAYYSNLVKKFPEKDYIFFITGSKLEGELIREEAPEIFNHENVIDMTGKLTLGELITFIDNCDALVACSTGPLHISAALGKNTIGLYPPMKPIDPGRWAALGKKTKILVLDKTCNDCRVSMKCHCLSSISTDEVYAELINIHE